MSPVFSGNFLIASIFQETPCQKFEVQSKEKGLHQNPVQVYDSGGVSLVWN